MIPKKIDSKNRMKWYNEEAGSLTISSGYGNYQNKNLKCGQDMKIVNVVILLSYILKPKYILDNHLPFG